MNEVAKEAIEAAAKTFQFGDRIFEGDRLLAKDAVEAAYPAIRSQVLAEVGETMGESIHVLASTIGRARVAAEPGPISADLDAAAEAVGRLRNLPATLTEENNPPSVPEEKPARGEADAGFAWRCQRCGYDIAGNPRCCPACLYTVYDRWTAPRNANAGSLPDEGGSVEDVPEYSITRCKVHRRELETRPTSHAICPECGPDFPAENIEHVIVVARADLRDQPSEGGSGKDGLLGRVVILDGEEFVPLSLVRGTEGGSEGEGEEKLSCVLAALRRAVDGLRRIVGETAPPGPPGLMSPIDIADATLGMVDVHLRPIGGLYGEDGRPSILDTTPETEHPDDDA